MAKHNPIQKLREWFQQEDERFLDGVRQQTWETQWTKNQQIEAFTAFADEWKTDQRPWARQQLFDYLRLPLNKPGHQGLVKRLFKHAEAQQDDALMGAFLVAFDRLIRRVIRQRGGSPRLVNPRDEAPTQGQEWTWGSYFVFRYASAIDKLYTHETRYYLRRRVWRYFRRMGFQRPSDYVPVIAQALKRYQDADFQYGQDVLDNWGMLHICYGKSDVLRKTASNFHIAAGRKLSELTPEPYFPELWQTETGFETLLSLTTDAESHLVRIWAIEMLKKLHAEKLPQLQPERYFEFFTHADDAVTSFGLYLLERHADLPHLPVAAWKKLLAVENQIVLGSLCELASQHLSWEQIGLEGTIDFANARSAPVARLGFRLVQSAAIQSAGDRKALTRLAHAKCEVMGREIGAWALNKVGAAEVYESDLVTHFFDSPQREVREAAWDWMTAKESPGQSDPQLWSRLLETPYEELRLRLVESLEHRSKDFAGADQLTLLWQSVLLGVFRGTRQKLQSLRQLGEYIEEHPDQFPRLLGVFAIAIRSIRGPEQAVGLSTLLQAVEHRPPWRALVQKELPELELESAEEVA